MITAKYICDQLNKLVEAAPITAHAIVQTRFQYKGSLDANLDFILFDDHEKAIDSPDRFSLGMLGIINGLIVQQNKVIRAEFDKTTKLLVRFRVVGK